MCCDRFEGMCIAEDGLRKMEDGGGVDRERGGPALSWAERCPPHEEEAEPFIELQPHHIHLLLLILHHIYFIVY